ncbi:MAG: HlyD family secretion protein, partial [Bacteroidales bacterium]|nr:HlyD family secretion protein [Bacteroidales bacterium]
MKKKIVWTIVVLVIVIAGVALIKFRKNSENKLPAAQIYATVVSAFKPEYGKIQLTLPYIALVQNDKDVKLTTKVSGRVEYIKPSGSKVSAGEVLIKLDITDIQGNINSLEAQIVAIKTVLENFKSTHKRTIELLAVKG